MIVWGTKKVLAINGQVWYSIKVVSRDIPLLRLQKHISIKNVKAIGITFRVISIAMNEEGGSHNERYY